MESNMQVNDGRHRARIIGVGVLAALVLASAISIIPRAQTSEVSAAQGLDIISLIKNTGTLLEEHYPAH
jgi:hypothetical protein